MHHLVTEDKDLEPFALTRIKICRECEYYSKQFYSCKKCGCFMPIKTRFKVFSCPVGKWKEVLDEDEQSN
jgi:hypothetical protein